MLKIGHMEFEAGAFRIDTLDNLCAALALHLGLPRDGQPPACQPPA
jgi:hypothetical protein